MILLPEKKVSPVKEFIDSLNTIILKLIDLIMLSAPYGVFALLATLVVEAPSLELFAALGLYSVTLLIGLTLMILVYAIIVKLLTGNLLVNFLKELHQLNFLHFQQVQVRQLFL